MLAEEAVDERVPVTRIAPGARPPTAPVAVVALLLAVAIVKPWGGETADDRRPRVVAPAASSSPPPRPSLRPRSGLADHCLDPGGWRVFSHERSAAGTIRSWKTVDPATAATGPLDPALPLVLVAAPRLPALGYCAPVRGPQAPPTRASLTIWRIEPGARPWRVAGRLVAPATATALGGLWAPAQRGNGSWAEGRLVFALRAPGYERWWAVEVVHSPDGIDAAAPGSSPPR